MIYTKNIKKTCTYIYDGNTKRYSERMLNSLADLGSFLLPKAGPPWTGGTRAAWSPASGRQAPPL